MPSITIKNIPDNLYEKIKKRAETNRRSINNEIINLLEQPFAPQKINVRELLEQARMIRKKMDFIVSEDDIRYAKNLDREC
ncbi:MAG: Arc family DNA-binding protein [Melioribacteraceae bacterium]|nr:Arc family DNA-binding protein [Melioribacteraceae bacterium]